MKTAGEVKTRKLKIKVLKKENTLLERDAALKLEPRTHPAPNYSVILRPQTLFSFFLSPSLSIKDAPWRDPFSVPTGRGKILGHTTATTHCCPRGMKGTNRRVLQNLLPRSIRYTVHSNILLRPFLLNWEKSLSNKVLMVDCYEVVVGPCLSFIIHVVRSSTYPYIQPLVFKGGSDLKTAKK